MSSAASEKNGVKSKGAAPTGRDARAKHSPAAAAAKSETTGSGSHSSPKKRRKVNHGKLPLRGMRQGSGSGSEGTPWLDSHVDSRWFC